MASNNAWMKMREIKFRVWDEINGKMYYPSKPWDNLRIFCDGWDLLLQDKDESVADGIDSVLLQFTGLRDKKGKEIYEGDICKDSLGGVYEIYWDEEFSAWALLYLPSKTRHQKIIAKNLEVVGNMYESMEEHWKGLQNVERK